MMPTADALEFSQELRDCLSPEQMAEVVECNRIETIRGVCHSHDFCDANMVLYAVFMRHDVDPVSEDGMERHGALWHQAWNLAESRAFQLAD
jgi:hypothetical protein